MVLGFYITENEKYSPYIHNFGTFQITSFYLVVNSALMVSVQVLFFFQVLKKLMSTKSLILFKKILNGLKIVPVMVGKNHFSLLRQNSTKNFDTFNLPCHSMLNNCLACWLKMYKVLKLLKKKICNCFMSSSFGPCFLPPNPKVKDLQNFAFWQP